MAETNTTEKLLEPFDRRLKRAIIFTSNKSDNTEDDNVIGNLITPYAGAEDIISIDQYYMNPENIPLIDSSGNSNADLIQRQENAITQALQSKNHLKYGMTPAVINPYVYTRLYGAEGSKYLLDSSTHRKFYELDGDDAGGYAKNPTTSTIIKWGCADEYGRTPYQFQDFVFCKYWNKIPNNRMITLRRFPQPILDNMNIPANRSSDNKNMKTRNNFHPIATAVTYMGEETGNKLSDILKFTAGLEWKEIEGDVWDSTTDPQKSYGDFAKIGNGNGTLGRAYSWSMDNMARALSVVDPSQSNWQANFGIPPDPYMDGPYENRVLGPMNSINKIYKREKGLKFEMDTLKINFEYCARPIGGINSKAILLDILGNFMSMGTASGVFFGGAHRFKISPTQYPFNSKATNDFYHGRIFGEEGAVRSTVTNFTSTMGTLGNGWSGIFKNIMGGLKALVSDILNSIGGKTLSALSGKIGMGVNGTDKELDTNAQRSLAGELMGTVGGVSYIRSMKAILTGDPIGDWHLVIGNPLNPIAMIGNLICDGITVTFGDELGPDDFPLSFSIEVSLKHGMPRDRDAIESMFNRGAGRIYELPGKLTAKLSSNNESKVDYATLHAHAQATGGYGYSGMGWTPQGGGINGFGSLDNRKGKLLQNTGNGTTLGKFGTISTSDETLSDINKIAINNNSVVGGYSLHRMRYEDIKIVM